MKNAVSQMWEVAVTLSAAEPVAGIATGMATDATQ